MRPAWKRKWDKENRDKVRAHKALYRAVRRGKIVKPTNCQMCGISGVRIIAHHHDYDKPLDIIWVCASCHIGKIHGMKKYEDWDMRYALVGERIRERNRIWYAANRHKVLKRKRERYAEQVVINNNT